MTRLLPMAVAVAVLATPAVAQFDVAPHRAAAEELIQSATRDSAAWQRLAQLTDHFGRRMSGSDNLERAIAWIVAEMQRDGLDNVHKERVLVTHSVRGAESAELLVSRRAPIHMLGLSRSVGTPAGGIRAPVPVANIDVDQSRYFWYHHSEADTMDKLDPRDMARCVAVLAVVANTVANMDAATAASLRASRQTRR